MSTDLNMEYQEVKFGDICREVKLTTKDPISDGYDKYIGLEHLDSGSLKIKRWGLIAEDNPTFTRVFKKGHILFGKRRCYLRKAAIAEFDGICSGDIIVLEPSNNLLKPDWLSFIIQSDNFWDWAEKNSSGSLSPRTKFKSLVDFPINLETSDANLEILKSCQKIKNEYDETIKAFYKLSEISLESALSVQNIAHTSLGDLLNNGDIEDIQDGNHGNDHPKASEYQSEGIPFLMASDLHDGIIDFNQVKYLSKERVKKLRIGFSKPGDILLSHKGTIGLVAKVPLDFDTVILTPQLTYYRVSSKGRILPEFLQIYFQSKKFQTLLKTLALQSTRSYIGISAQKRLPIPLLDIDKQKEIIDVWTSLKKAEELIVKANLNHLGIYKNFLNG
ncbi:restriction endonuclease subunit S [Acinetobacter baumannii]|nr:restriction endonuclease subunit S [Acinetobacter baumannii]